jgi:nitroreductase
VVERVPDHPIDPMFVERWSPRAFDGSSMAEEKLLRLLEAGRWAPSAFNLQPWRFIYALRDTAPWALFLDVLIPFNQLWAATASALVYVLSENDSRPGEPSYSHSFDAGAAWGFISLQAHLAGYAAHAMTGFDVERAHGELRVPKRLRVEAAVAIGRRGDPAQLPDGLRKKEHPSDRRPLAQLAHPGLYPS